MDVRKPRPAPGRNPNEEQASHTPVMSLPRRLQKAPMIFALDILCMCSCVIRDHGEVHEPAEGKRSEAESVSERDAAYTRTVTYRRCISTLHTRRFLREARGSAGASARALLGVPGSAWRFTGCHPAAAPLIYTTTCVVVCCMGLIHFKCCLQTAFELYFNNGAGQAQAAPTDPAALHTLYELYRDPDQVHTHTHILPSPTAAGLSPWCVVISPIP